VCRRVGRPSLVVAAAAAASGLTLAAVGCIQLGQRSLTALARWITSYGGERLPHWGVWQPERIPLAAWSAVRSLVPVPNLDQLQGRWAHPTEPTSWLPWLALAALLALATTTFLGIANREKHRNPGYSAIGLVVGYGAFLPFIVWWDPVEIKWFVLPNLFLAGLVSMGLGRAGRPDRATALAACCVAVIASSVFWLRIWPEHTTEAAASRRARCLAEKTTDSDLLVATDWGWCGQLSYFHHRDVVQVIDLTLGGREREQVLAALATRLDRTRTRGGSVFMLDLSRAPARYLERLARQTGVSPGDWDRLEADPAFVCDGLRFVRVNGVRPAPTSPPAPAPRHPHPE
jgi:hypothetical protein